MSEITYKPLRESFTESGFVHEILERTGDIAIFRRFKQGSSREHFEVIRVCKHNGFRINGVDIPPAETYPPTTQWGVNGWTLPDEESARAKAAELLA